MKQNRIVQNAIWKYLESYLSKNGASTVDELLNGQPGDIAISEAEFRDSLKEALMMGYLRPLNTSKQGKILIDLASPFESKDDHISVKIVVSKPRLNNISLDTVMFRNNQIDITDCFTTIIKSSNNVLRICSPFMQRDVLDIEAFPQLKTLLENALYRGVNIKIISRELFLNRGSELKWLKNLAAEADRSDQLKIVDYHVQYNTGQVYSSTHAKLLIADDQLAYTGSAELRKNSLVANFETGCMITGSPVIGLCEIFDAMFMRGVRY